MISFSPASRRPSSTPCPRPCSASCLASRCSTPFPRPPSGSEGSPPPPPAPAPAPPLRRPAPAPLPAPSRGARGGSAPPSPLPPPHGDSARPARPCSDTGGWLRALLSGFSSLSLSLLFGLRRAVLLCFAFSLVAFLSPGGGGGGAVGRRAAGCDAQRWGGGDTRIQRRLLAGLHPRLSYAVPSDLTMRY